MAQRTKFTPRRYDPIGDKIVLTAYTKKGDFEVLAEVKITEAMKRKFRMPAIFQAGYEKATPEEKKKIKAEARKKPKKKTAKK